MTRAHALVALGASVAVLAGCTPAPELPRPLSDAEVAQRVDADYAAWWESMFPDEPRPYVEPVEVLAESDGAQVLQCMKDAHIDGVLFSDDFSWSYIGEDNDGLGVVNRQYYICSLQYPLEPSASGYLSDEEYEWIFNYDKERLVPCLKLLGYTVDDGPDEFVPDGNFGWIPYYQMYPMPTAAEWARIDFECPPSPVGPLLRPNTP